jgi:hypothetical protein
MKALNKANYDVRFKVSASANLFSSLIRIKTDTHQAVFAGKQEQKPNEQNYPL